MQPLDKTVMGALKTYYSEEVRVFMRKYNRAISHFDVCELFGNAYVKIQIGQRAVKSFTATGIYPIRRRIFSDNDFIAEQQIHEETRIQLQEDTDINVHPDEHIPLPQLKKMRTRGRQCGQSKIFTSTPNKEDLEQSISKQREKVMRRIADDVTPGPSGIISKPKKKICKPRKPSTSSSASENEDSLEENFSQPNDRDSSDDDIPLNTSVSQEPNSDVACIFCEELFSTSKSREIWIQCVMCEGWAHEVCTGNKNEVYICGFCK